MRDVGGVAGRPAAAEFDASVVLPDRVRIVVGAVGEIFGPFQGEGVLHALVEALVVGPHAQHIVGLLLPDWARNLLLAAQGVLHPVPEALLETGRIQPREDPPQRIMRGDPVRQGQEGAQPVLVELAQERNRHETVGPADDGQHRQHQDVGQGVPTGAVDPRIL